MAESTPADTTALPAVPSQAPTSETGSSSTVIRAPSTHTLPLSKREQSSAATISPPAFDWIKGSWDVVYSSLPMWKDKQNVRITYKQLQGQTGADSTKMPDLDDLVEYQKIGGKKVSTVNGISRPVQVADLNHGLAYSWRGKGWLKIASSDWEILGWGKDESNPKNDWVVTYFSKTMFTPAGIDIYSRTEDSVSEGTLKAIKDALSNLGEPSMKILAESLFEIPRTKT